MATNKIGVNLRSYLAASTDVNAIVGGSSSATNARIYSNEEPQQGSSAWVWMQRTREEQEQLLDGTYSQIIESEFDLECVIRGTQADADDLADKVKSQLKAATPGSTMGSDPIRAVTYDDHSEDYVPRTGRVDGYSIAVLRATIYHTT